MQTDFVVCFAVAGQISKRLIPGGGGILSLWVVDPGRVHRSGEISAYYLFFSARAQRCGAPNHTRWSCLEKILSTRSSMKREDLRRMACIRRVLSRIVMGAGSLAVKVRTWLLICPVLRPMPIPMWGYSYVLLDLFRWIGCQHSRKDWRAV